MIRRLRRSRVKSEINITPFTDVVLVLMIIFMITTPMLVQSEQADSSKGSSESGFDVQLPMAKQGGGIKTAVLPIVVSILEDGRMVLGGEEVSEDSLKEKFEQVKAQNAQAMVIIQADRMVSHWRVVKTMDIAASVGLKHMAIATQEE